jgi:endonuclease/exonuclease/phosphatase (EEP) superfamily protein YafD
MRFISLFPGLLLSLILSGCVTNAVQQSGPDIGPEAQNVESLYHCDVEKLVQHDRGNAGSITQGLNPERISVLNWNTYKGKRDNWVIDFKRYSYRHDVLMLQEANLDDDLISLLDSEHPYWVLNDAFNYHDKATGVMTASRVRPVRNCGQRIAEPFIRFPKTSLLSYYPIEGMNENLLVANIHGINFTLGVGVYKEQIQKLYDVMKYHHGPIVLAGDFNTWSDARMQIVDDLAQRLSLHSLDYTSHNRTIVFGNAIDHVFYRGLEPLEHDTWHVTSSDHNPTRVSFRVKDNALVDTDLVVGELDDENC